MSLIKKILNANTLFFATLAAMAFITSNTSSTGEMGIEKYFYKAIGIIGFWFFSISFSAFITDPNWKKSKINNFFSIMGFLAAILLVFESARLMTLEFSTEAFLLGGRVSLIIFSICLIYVVFCSFTFWARFQVNKNDINLLNKKVFYPGEKYFSFPFINSRRSIIKGGILKIPIRRGILSCRDVYLETEMEIKVKLLIDRMKESNIRKMFDLSDFIDKVREKAIEIIAEKSESKTYGELLTTPFEPEIFQVGEIFAEWNGKVVYRKGRVSQDEDFID